MTRPTTLCEPPTVRTTTASGRSSAATTPPMSFTSTTTSRPRGAPSERVYGLRRVVGSRDRPPNEGRVGLAARDLEVGGDGDRELPRRIAPVLGFKAAEIAAVPHPPVAVECAAPQTEPVVAA